MEDYWNPNELNGVPPPIPLIRRDGGIEVFYAYTMIAGKQVRVGRKIDHVDDFIKWFVLERGLEGWKEISVEAGAVVFAGPVAE
jgi:hypothetical protein